MNDEMTDAGWNRYFDRKAAERGKQILCPYHKLGVAYMPVPRCETCAHWDSSYGAINPGWGVCRGLRTADKLVLNADVGLSAVAQITTGADFGCVRWKSK